MDGWKEFSDRIINELDRIHKDNDELKQELKDINKRFTKDLIEKETRLTRVEVRSGWYGAIGGAVTSMAAMIVMFLKGKF